MFEYSVFAPTTAEQVTSGRTFPDALSQKGRHLKTDYGTNGDYYLNQAARGAAERILDHFTLARNKKPPEAFRSLTEPARCRGFV